MFHLSSSFYDAVSIDQGRIEGGGGLPGCSSSQTPQNQNLKNTDFVDIMISNVLRGLPFS
jgi:hypothetical protein